MESVLSRLKGVALSLVSDEVPSAPVAPASGAVAHATAPVTAPVSGSAPSAPITEADPKILAKLSKAVFADGGSKYLLFAQAFKDLVEEVPDERKRITVILKMNKLQPADIASALDTHLTALETELASFQETSEAEEKRTIGGAEDKAKVLAKSLGDKEAELASLQQEISELKEQITVNESSIVTAKRRISDMAARFMTAYNFLKSTLIAERTRFKKGA